MPSKWTLDKLYEIVGYINAVAQLDAHYGYCIKARSMSEVARAVSDQSGWYFSEVQNAMGILAFLGIFEGGWGTRIASGLKMWHYDPVRASLVSEVDLQRWRDRSKI